MDGLPLIHVSDTWKDLSYVLSALYNGYKFFNHTEPWTFPAISAFLQLGHKYEIPELQEAATSRLKACFPEELTYFKNKKTGFYYYSENMLFDPPIIRMRPDEVLGVINLARAHDLSSLLPSAFFLASSLPVMTLINGSNDQDRNQFVLSKEDTARCIEGHSKLVRREVIELPLMPYQVAKKCTSRLCNIADVLKPTISNWDKVIGGAGDCFPDGSWFVDVLNLEDICKPCREGLEERWEEYRHAIWSNLSDIFLLQVNTGDVL